MRNCQPPASGDRKAYWRKVTERRVKVDVRHERLRVPATAEAFANLGWAHPAADLA